MIFKGHLRSSVLLSLVRSFGLSVSNWKSSRHLLRQK